MAQLSIAGSGRSFQVMIGRRAVSQRRFTSTGNAIAALPGIESSLRPATVRSCLCCGTAFASAGPGNRLCDPCRQGRDA